MALKPTTLRRINELMRNFAAYLKFRAIGPHVLSKKELKDLVRSGLIKPGSTTTTAVAQAYLKTHENVADKTPAPKATRDGAIDFLERSFERYSTKAAQQFTTDLVSILESQVMPFRDRAEGEAIYGVLRDKQRVKKYLGNALNDQVKSWTHRWRTIVNTELGRASNYGAMDAILYNNSEKEPSEILVYKTGPKDSVMCGKCGVFWFSNDGVTPKVYKLSELMANGTNIGRKAADWRPTVDSTHPNCFTESRTPVLTDSGWKAIRRIQVGDLVLTHTGKFKKVTAVINEPYAYKKTIHISYEYLGRAQKVRVTPDHKFLTQRGWIEARDLRSDDSFVGLVYPCAICGKQVNYAPSNGATSKFKLGKTCSAECESKLSSVLVKKYHDSLSEEEKIIRAANVSDGISKWRSEAGIKSPFENPSYWTPERRERSRKLTVIGRKASAKTRVSREQRLAFAWLKKNYPEKKIVLEHGVGPYSIDIALPNEKIAVEIDGRFHSGDRLDTDRKRTVFLKEKGWSVLRFGFGQKAVSKSNVIKGVQNVLNNHEGRYSFFGVKILEITQSETGAKGRVYCLSVEDDESFIARGIVSHNCRHFLVELPPGWGFKNGDLTYVGAGHNEYEHQRNSR